MNPQILLIMLSAAAAAAALANLMVLACCYVFRAVAETHAFHRREDWKKEVIRAWRR